MYIDDGIYAAESRDQCVEGTNMIIDDLTSAGIIMSERILENPTYGIFSEN